MRKLPLARPELDSWAVGQDALAPQRRRSAVARKRLTRYDVLVDDPIAKDAISLVFGRSVVPSSTSGDLLFGWHHAPVRPSQT